MSIRHTRFGTWQVRWRDPTGRQRAQTFRTQAAAKDFERETLVDQRRGHWVDPDRGKITLEAWAAEWMGAGHNLRPRTIETYQTVLNHLLPELGRYQIGRITDTQIDDYLRGRLAAGLAPSTVHRHYRTLRRLFRVAVARGRIPVSPIDQVEAPRIPRTEMRFLTAAQLETLADAIDHHPGDRTRSATSYRSLILVAGWGGPRWGEMAGLRVGRVDITGSRVHVVEQLDPEGRNPAEPKTDAGRRWVALPASVTAEVADHVDGKNPDDLVWTSPRGFGLRHATFRLRYFKPATIAAGLEGVTFHDLRHTSVALAIAAGAHPKAIKARMGHSSIQVTLDLYGHLFPDLDTSLAANLDDTRSGALAARRKLRVV